LDFQSNRRHREQERTTANKENEDLVVNWVSALINPFTTCESATIKMILVSRTVLERPLALTESTMFDDGRNDPKAIKTI
jgi:hypothetical protein